MRVADMAKDMHEFVQQHFARPPILIGHSLGGRVMARQALEDPQGVAGLIVLDMNVEDNPLSGIVTRALAGLDELQTKLPQVSTLREADHILAGHVKDMGTRRFLLQNLVSSNGKFRLALNLNAIKRSFPFHMHPMPRASFDRPSLWVAADPARDAILTRKDFGHIRAYFPKSEFQVIEGAGHWLHVDAGEALLNLVERFMGKMID